jgi:hypothetical protein
MPWGYILLAFTSLCGVAFTAYLLIESLTYVRRGWGSLTSGQRRRALWMQAGVWGLMLVAAGVITAAYKWGSATWSTRAGAAVAIGAFVLLMVAVFVGLGLQVRREARQDRERHAAAQQQ